MQLHKKSLTQLHNEVYFIGEWNDQSLPRFVEGLGYF